MLKLYWGPHTCAIGIHVLLEEIGAPYAAEKIDVGGGATHEPWFRAINPKGKVPTIVRDDGSALTEFGAIATWLALTHPEAGLLPDEADEVGRAYEAMDYAVGTIHAQGFGRMFKPQLFEPQDVVHQTAPLGRGSVKQQGQAMIEEGFGILDARLAGREWVAGERFGIADAALFYVARWAPEKDIALPANLAAHLERVRARPAVRRVLHVWGEG